MMRSRVLGMSAACLLATAVFLPVSASPASRGITAGDTPSDMGIAWSARTTCPGASPHALSRVDDRAGDELEALQAKYEGEPGFRAVIHDGSGFVVVVDRDSLSAWQKRVSDPAVNVAVSCVPEGIAEAVAEAASTFKLGKGEFISTGYNAIADAIIVESTLADVAIREALEKIRPDAAALVNAATDGPSLLRTVTFERGSVRRQYRMDEHPPVWGGARIYFSMGGGFYEGCTTGFYINSATNGTVMVTAGHCGQNGQNGQTAWNGDLSDTLGTSEGAHFPDPDLTVLDGESYQAISYSGSDWTTSDYIKNSTNPTTATTYCEYGATSLRVCYQYDQLSTQFCDEYGCTNSLAHAVAPHLLNQPGDSGGGVFKEASDYISARGTVVAGGCNQYNCIAWDHKRQTILSTFDASVVLWP